MINIIETFEHIDKKHCDVFCKNRKKIKKLKKYFNNVLTKYNNAHKGLIENRDKNQTLTNIHKRNLNNNYDRLKNIIDYLKKSNSKNGNEIVRNNKIIINQTELITSKNNKIISNKNIINSKNDTLLSRSTSLDDNNKPYCVVRNLQFQINFCVTTLEPDFEKVVR